MPHFKSNLFTAAGLAALIVAAPLAAQAVGVTAVVRNNVQVTTVARPVLHKASVRETIAIDNDIVTGGQSMTQLLLLDKTSFTVGANSRIRIDRFVYDPRARQSAVSATVAKGAFRFMSGSALNKGKERSAINTPVASIGIRGTIVEGVVGAEAIRIARAEAGIPRSITADPETATLIVLRGPGRNAQGTVRGAIDITVGNLMIAVEDAGMAVFIPGAGQQPIGPFLLSHRGTVMLHGQLGPRGCRAAFPNGSPIPPPTASSSVQAAPTAALAVRCSTDRGEAAAPFPFPPIPLNGRDAAQRARHHRNRQPRRGLGHAEAVPALPVAARSSRAAGADRAGAGAGGDFQAGPAVDGLALWPRDRPDGAGDGKRGRSGGGACCCLRGGAVWRRAVRQPAQHGVRARRPGCDAAAGGERLRPPPSRCRCASTSIAAPGQ